MSMYLISKDENTIKVDSTALLKLSIDALNKLMELMLKNLETISAKSGVITYLNSTGHHGYCIVHEQYTTLEKAKILGETIENVVNNVRHNVDDLQSCKEFSGPIVTDVNLDTRTIKVCNVINGNICPSCGCITRCDRAHVTSINCKVMSATRECRESGWSEIDCDSYLIRELKRAQIDSKRLLPSDFSIWVQPWVMDAIATYKNNGGFAGMTLAEYLEKLEGNGLGASNG